MSKEKRPEGPDRGMVITDLATWEMDPREQMRREIGEQQRRNVKRRRKRTKTQPKDSGR